MKKYIPVILSALLMGISQQPLHLGFLAWIALIPLLFNLEKIESWKSVFITGFLWGFTYHLTSIFWLAMNIGTSPPVAFLSMVVSVLVLTVNTLIILSLWFIVKKGLANFSIWSIPFIWTIVEYWRSFGTLGFPWVSLANSQTEYLTLIQNAEYTGIYGISFWIVLINVVFFKLQKENFSQYRVRAGILFIIPWISGMLIFPEPNNEKTTNISVAIVQPNIPLEQKWYGNVNDNLNQLLKLSQPSMSRSVDIIIWPESAIHTYLLQSGKRFLNRIRAVLDDNTTVLTGIPYSEFEDKNRKIYNSITAINKFDIENVYHKMQLVPMAEYVPWSNTISLLGELNLGQGNFSQGDEYVMFEKNGIQYGAVVCFESTFPSIFRKFANDGAEFMVVVTNDGWYETPPEPQQHAGQSIFRAIETRKPILRCANTGISMVVEPSGNIRKKLVLNSGGVIETDINPVKRVTFYTKYGDKFAQLAGLISLCFLILSVLKQRNEN